MDRFEDFGAEDDDQDFNGNESGESNEEVEEVNGSLLFDDTDTEDEKSSRGTQIKSSLELRQERLKTKIQSLEENLISEKPWQMKGEVSATKRPQNSLLEEVVEFDLTTRPGMCDD